MNAGEKQKHAGEKEDKSETKNSENIMNNASKWWHEPAHIIQTAAVGVGTIVALIYIGQLCQMIKSNNINREALESVQRAFISFNHIQEERSLGRTAESPKEEHWWSITPVIENSGTTPAQEVIDFDAIDELTDEPKGDVFIGNAKDFSIASIGPKNVQGMGVLNREESFIFGRDLTDLSSVRLAPRDKPIFVWGWIAYRDTFPKTKAHVTEFCAKLVNLTVMTDKSLRWVMGTCKTHNCTDEYCEDYETISAKVPVPVKPN
jgi:hypothetical protein